MAVLEVVFEGKKATVPIFEHRLVGRWEWILTSTPREGFPEPQFETGEKIFIRIFDVGKMRGEIEIISRSGERLRNRFGIISKRWVGTLDGTRPRPLITIEILERWGKKLDQG